MKIIEVARQQRDILNEGMAYVAVWQQAQKNGKRSWFTEDFFPVDTDAQSDPIFDEEQKARLLEIAALDSDAVLLNGYYHSWIGSADEPLNAASIAKGIENHYLMHNALITNYFADENAEANETAEADQTANPTMQNTEEKQEPASEPTATVTNDHGGEYDGNGEYIRGTGEAVYSPESGMSSEDVPMCITVEIPFTGNEQILTDLLNSKASLIRASLGEDGIWYSPDQYSPENPGPWYGPEPQDEKLPIEFKNGKVRFTWFHFGTDGETVTAWSAFLAAAVKFSKTAKRITAKDKTVENEKFAFRTFLVKIGLNDAENKGTRKRLLQNLKGDAAFATVESKERWLAKHGRKADTAVTVENETEAASKGVN